MSNKLYLVKPEATIPSEPHLLTPQSEAAARAFINAGMGHRTLHLSKFNCAVVSAGTTMIGRLRELYEGKGNITETVRAIDSLQALLAFERVRVRDYVAVRELLDAEGKTSRGV
jgi:hypothetical protein